MGITKRNKTFTGTSPAPEPGGIGFVKPTSLKKIINSKILTIVYFIFL